MVVGGKIPWRLYGEVFINCHGLGLVKECKVQNTSDID